MYGRWRLLFMLFPMLAVLLTACGVPPDTTGLQLTASAVTPATEIKDPAALEAIRTLLSDYRHPNAERYEPQQATLFLSRTEGTMEAPTAPWPLEGIGSPRSLAEHKRHVF